MLWIGYGQAGGKIANALMQVRKKIYDAIAVNTDEADLLGLPNVPAKILVGKYLQKGRGVGADIELGADLARKAVSQIMDAIDVRSREFDPEAIWIIAALAGGTGAGGAHVLANELKEVYHRRPVYGLGVLPSASAMPSQKEALCLANALHSLDLWRCQFHNVLLVDNQQYERDMDTRESLEGMYKRVNQDIANKLNTFLSAGEVRPAPQEVFDASDMIATLGFDGDVSTIGYQSEAIRLRSRLRNGGIVPDANKLQSMIEESTTESLLTFPCQIVDAKSAALVRHGRPEHLFTQAIINGTAHLEHALKVGAVRHGDYPDTRGKHLAAATIVSGVNDFSRLEQMRRRVEELGHA